MSHRLLLLLCVVGCGSSRAATSSPPIRHGLHPSPQAICPPADVGLLLASIEPVSDVTLDVDAPGGVRPPDWQGVMVVDGVVTSAKWPEKPPIVYALADGRRVLYDAYNENRAYLWERDTKKLTDLGRVGLAPAGSGGRLIVRYEDDRSVYTAVAPDKPALVEVWRVPPDHSANIIGEVDGTPVGIAIPAHRTERGEQRQSQHVKLMCLTGNRDLTTHSITLPPGLRVASSDSIRGHRMLLLGRSKSDGDVRDVWTPAFSVDVWILDLDRRKPRKIGTVPGSYTQFTAVPHPYVNVEWSDSPLVPRATIPGSAQGLALTAVDDNVTHLVDPTAEAVR